MSVDEQISSLLEVITFIITKLSYEEVLHFKSSIFSDYFRKHLNLLEERRKETKVEEEFSKKQNNVIENLEKVIQNNEFRNNKAEKTKTEIEIPNIMDVENNPKRLRTQKKHIQTQKFVIKAQTLESLSENMRKRHMEALNEKIFDSKQPTLKDQTNIYNKNRISCSNQSQSSFKIKKTLISSSGLELQTDNVMAIKDTSPDINQRKKANGGDKLHCTLCRRYYYISQRHYCFTVSNGKEILCNLCEHRFDTIKSFKIHFSLKHFQEYKDKVEKHVAKKCRTCLKEFENSVAMIVHVREEHEGNSTGWPMMPCPSCDRVCANADLLLQHIQDIHDREDTVLDYSGIIEGTYELTDASAYCDENNPNSPVIDFKCRQCGMRFSKNETLQAHENLHGKK